MLLPAREGIHAVLSNMRQNSSKCDYIIRKVYTEDIHHEKSKGRYCRSWEIREGTCAQSCVQDPQCRIDGGMFHRAGRTGICQGGIGRYGCLRGLQGDVGTGGY